MTECGGCGRDIETEGLEEGSVYLCKRCFHRQTVGRDIAKPGAYRRFLVLSIAALVVLGLTCLSLCLLYLVGTGNQSGFMTLCYMAVIIVAFPVVVLILRRNIRLLVASLYIPVGVLSALWMGVPGVNWQYSNPVTFSTVFFLALGFGSLILFIRDTRVLPRI